MLTSLSNVLSNEMNGPLQPRGAGHSLQRRHGEQELFSSPRYFDNQKVRNVTVTSKERRNAAQNGKNPNEAMGWFR